MPGVEPEKHVKELVSALRKSKSNIYVEPIQSGSLYSIARVNTNSSGDYFQICLYHKKRKFMRFLRSAGLPPFQACFEEKDEADKILCGHMGTFHFYEGQCDVGHVAHEVYHAVERNKDWLIEWSLGGRHRFESEEKVEESMAAVIGFLTKEIYDYVINETRT